MKRGLIVGKFYPFHKGHQYLVETGMKQVDELTVVVCELDEHTISGELRATWIRRLYPEVRVLVKSYEGIDPDDSKIWAELAVEWMGGRKPDVVFTSEDYGERWARELECEHVLVDKARVKVPVSGTLVREDPFKMWQYLDPVVRSYYVKKICIVGAESSGTTTLVKDLAEMYQTVFVPEYGRVYSEARMYDRSGKGEEFLSWNSDEFVHIAEMQNKMEDELILRANKVMFCDTDSFATNVWHKRYMGFYSKRVENLTKGREYDLYVVTDIDIPFVQDGTRDGEKIREWMHEEFIKELEKRKKPYMLVNGSRKERLKKVRRKVGEIMKVR